MYVCRLVLVLVGPFVFALYSLRSLFVLLSCVLSVKFTSVQPVHTSGQPVHPSAACSHQCSLFTQVKPVHTSTQPCQCTACSHQCIACSHQYSLSTPVQPVHTGAGSLPILCCTVHIEMEKLSFLNLSFSNSNSKAFCESFWWR